MLSVLASEVLAFSNFLSFYTSEVSSDVELITML